MTEKEWLESNDVDKILPVVRGERKLRLFAVACCRQIWHLIGHEDSKKAVEVAELYADGLATKEQLVAARNSAWNAAYSSANQAAWNMSSNNAYGAAYSAAYDAARNAVMNVAYDSARCTARNVAYDAAYNAASNVAYDAARLGQANLLREIFGNPYKPLTLNTEWLSWNQKTISKMAQNIYDNKDFGSMPVLADALEDAGCNIQEVLEHCRTGEHVKGCWAIDIIIGK